MAPRHVTTRLPPAVAGAIPRLAVTGRVVVEGYAQVAHLGDEARRDHARLLRVGFGQKPTWIRPFRLWV